MVRWLQLDPGTQQRHTVRTGVRLGGSRPRITGSGVRLGGSRLGFRVGMTYGLSLGSPGAVRAGHSPVSLLSLFSGGANQTNQTRVTLLSLRTRIAS